MVQKIDAIYENGVLRPTEPLKCLPEHARVRVTAESTTGKAADLTDVLGSMSDEEAAEISGIIEAEFRRSIRVNGDRRTLNTNQAIIIQMSPTTHKTTGAVRTQTYRKLGSAATRVRRTIRATLFGAAGWKYQLRING